jgi:hypothetical protein
MRKTFGFLCAAALMVPIGVITASPASAAGGTTCSKATGTAYFKPPLPKLGSTKTVKSKLSASGTVTGCTGGGVKGGHFTFAQTSTPTAGNCQTLVTVKKSDPPTVGTLTMTWNTGKKSTAKGFKIKQTDTTTATTTGKITSGLFAGKTISGTVTFTPEKDGCTNKDLSKVTFVNKKGTKFLVK